jgi:Rad3-related DNA helicase
MILGEKGVNVNTLVTKFRKSTAPSVLVSPSVSTGFDFPYSQCDYQIICKVPFPDLRGEANQKRKNKIKKWGEYLTFQSLVQSIGRGMRAADDFCENFIIDDHIGWFVSKNKADFPEWFLSAFSRHDIIPVQRCIDLRAK